MKRLHSYRFCWHLYRFWKSTNPHTPGLLWQWFWRLPESDLSIGFHDIRVWCLYLFQEKGPELSDNSRSDKPEHYVLLQLRQRNRGLWEEILRNGRTVRARALLAVLRAADVYSRGAGFLEQYWWRMWQRHFYGKIQLHEDVVQLSTRLVVTSISLRYTCVQCIYILCTSVKTHVKHAKMIAWPWQSKEWWSLLFKLRHHS